VNTVTRSPVEKLANPERLNLDRQSLSACPVLEGEERLRLLNYQNNSIRKIEHLIRLPNLIFLDLYSNEISRIDGLQAVPTLRVLMLGKNRIETVEGLEPLRKLDVLDLHCNRIERLQGISHLSALRVLNLAGNCLGCIEPDAMCGLSSLVELNLRRNRLSRVPSLETAPSLQRLFLSSNLIAEPAGLQNLSSARNLVEVAVDGNPIAVTPEYRSLVIGLCPNLRHLDLRRLSDEERASAGDGGGGASVDPAVAACSGGGASPTRVQVGGGAVPRSAGDDRSHAVLVASQRWRLSMESEAGRSAATELRAEAPDGTRRWLVELCDAERPGVALGESRQVPGEYKQVYGEKKQVPGESGHVPKGDCPVGLSVFGQPQEESLRGTIDAAAPRLAWVSFQYASFGWVLAEALPRLAQAGRLTELRLSHNNISAPAELLALRVLPRLTRLTIDDANNPAVHSTHFRSLVMAALPALETLNGQAITEGERAVSVALWRRLHRLYGMAARCKQPLSAPIAHQLACGVPPVPAQAGGSDEDVAGSSLPGAPVASHNRDGLREMDMVSPALRRVVGEAQCNGERGASSEPRESRERSGSGCGVEGGSAAARRSDGLREMEVVGTFVRRVVGHGLAVHEKVCRLNVLWPELVRRYDEAVARELEDSQALVRRYESVVYGDRPLP
jgi:hypothetical protein